MKQIVRKESGYCDMSVNFTLHTKNYQKQFFHLYAFRLSEMTKLLTPVVRKKYGMAHSIKKLCELREETPETCIVIGTIFKHQAFKPSILREISEENQLAPQPQRQHYCDPEDKLILEDELQRVRLFGKVDGRFMATGVICAVLGCMEEDGQFEVDDLVFYESGPQKSLPMSKENAGFIVLMSGLDQDQSHHLADSLNLFQHWLSGNFGGKNCINPINVVRLIVIGNSVRSVAEGKMTALQVKTVERSNTLEAIQNLDRWFTSWCQTISVDVMPGECDPANFMLPQQPFHRCMFQQAARSSSFRCVTNPYACQVSDLLVMGTSGQNIKDILRTTNIDNELEALRSTLKWSHISPTSPDTLACYPYEENDPFIIKECPHVYFAGNCDFFETDLHVGSAKQNTRIVCVPAFSKTQEIAVVSLNNLTCTKVSFKI